jgi:arylsulfatase A-like enzyme
MKLSRRHFVFSSLALPALAADKKPGGETPHIVLILAGNVPSFALGCYGNKEVSTPNIDRLAKTGTRFLNHIAGSAAPEAARAALLTGSPAGSGDSLDKMLAAAGYAIAAAGSGDEAVKIIDAPPAGKPMFLTVNLNGFTPPYAAGAKFLDRYAASKWESFEQIPAARNIVPADAGLFGAGLPGNLRKAAAALTALDDEVGAIQAKLAQKKMVDSTLVIFTAPTGTLLGRHGLWGGSAGSDPTNFYEEVIATPMIWTWPARVAPFGSRPEIVSAFDLVTTLCDLTPANLPPASLPGRSYLLLAQGKMLPKKQPWRSTAFLAAGSSGVARDDRYKLVLRNDSRGPNELYDLRADARESVNQFDNPQFLTVKTQLTGELAKWRKTYAV